MQSLKLALRMLSRDWRAGELTVLVAAIVLAVGSVGTVEFFADRVKTALTRQANLLLGADVLVSGDRALPQSMTDEARRRGLASTPALKFNSMVQRAGADAGGGAVLADVKAVSSGYPLRGAIMLVDARSPDGVAAPGIPPRGEAWPDMRLAARLSVKAGDSITVGEATLKVGAIVQQEPEVASGLLSIGPRLLVNLDDVPATNLLQPGNRATWRLLVADLSNRDRLDPYLTWLVGRAQAWPANGERARPAAGDPADARARRPVPGTLVPRCGGAGRRSGRAGGIALSAPPSRHRGHAPLLRRFARPDACALRDAICDCRSPCERVGHPAGACGAAAARDAACVDCRRRSPSTRHRSRAGCVCDRDPSSPGICVAAVDRACRCTAAARPSPRPAAPAPRRHSGLRARCLDDRGVDRLAGAGREDRRDRRCRHRRIARGGGAHRVAPGGVAEAPAATRGDVAIRSRQPAAAAARIQPADRRAGARAHGTAAAHGGARRSDPELAREPAAGRAQPLSRQRSAGPGRRRARRAESRSPEATPRFFRWFAGDSLP